MNYLNQTVALLQQQNKQLHTKLKQLTSLNTLLTEQTQQQSQSYLRTCHQQEIAVIREIAESNEQQLKQQISQLQREITESNQLLSQEMDRGHDLKMRMAQLERQKYDIREQLEKDIQNHRKEISEEKQHVRACENLWKHREQQIIQRCIERLEQQQDKHQASSQESNTQIEQLKRQLTNSQQEKSLLSEEIQTLSQLLRSEQAHRHRSQKQRSQENQELSQTLHQMRLEEKSLRLSLKQLEHELEQEKRSNGELRQQLTVQQRKAKETTQKMKKELELEQYRTKSVSKGLLQTEKYLQEQQKNQQKRDQKHRMSRKTLMQQIKNIEYKYQQPTTPIQYKTKSARNSTKPTAMQSHGSVSLETSLLAESPVVTGFKESSAKSLMLHLKPQLQINTKEEEGLLKLKDLDTPCFEASRGSNHPRKTITLRK